MTMPDTPKDAKMGTPDSDRWVLGWYPYANFYDAVRYLPFKDQWFDIGAVTTAAPEHWIEMPTPQTVAATKAVIEAARFKTSQEHLECGSWCWCNQQLKWAVAILDAAEKGTRDE